MYIIPQSMKMQIKIIFPPKGSTTLNFKDEATFSSLILEASKLTAWPEKEIILKKGFPPQAIDQNEDCKLTEFIESGERIILQNIKQSGTQASTKRPIPKSVLKQNSNKSQFNSIATLSNAPPKGINKNSKFSSKKPLKNKSPQDWAENLIQVFEQSSRNLNTAEKSLKGVFNNAIQRRYRSSQAEKRWASVQGSTYEINLVFPYKFIVTYPCGPRSKTKEQYVALPKELMSSVIKEAYNSGESSRMNLRPYYLAEAQPMIFWNLVRLFNGDISLALSELMPEVDWSFIEDRHRELSEKAKENIRQKREAEDIRDENRQAKKRRKEFCTPKDAL